MRILRHIQHWTCNFPSTRPSCASHQYVNPPSACTTAHAARSPPLARSSIRLPLLPHDCSPSPSPPRQDAFGRLPFPDAARKNGASLSILPAAKPTRTSSHQYSSGYSPRALAASHRKRPAGRYYAGSDLKGSGGEMIVSLHLEGAFTGARR